MNTPSIQARRMERAGFAAFEAGRIQEAEEAFRLAAIVAPERTDAWIGLGSALACQERHQEAAIVFAIGAISAPEDAWPVLLAAEAHLALGQSDQVRGALAWVDGLADRGKVNAEQEGAARALRARAARLER